VIAVTLMLGPDGGVHTGGLDVFLLAVPDVIITVPLNTLVASMVFLVIFGSEGAMVLAWLAMGPCGPLIGMIFFRGTRASAPSQLGM
jgi:hypothetical protein